MSSRQQMSAMAPAVAVGYLRRSTDRQEQSIEDQRRALVMFAEEQDLKITEYYTDDAISGTSAIKRPAFLRMVADSERGRFRFVIVYDVKRFGRLDNDEAGYYRHVLKRNGVEVLYATEGFAGDDTEDLLRPVKQWQARQESKDLSKVTIRGLLSKAGSGSWMGGVPPYGYDLKYESGRGEFLFVIRYNRDRSKLQLDGQGAIIRTLLRGESVSVSKRDRCVLVPSAPERVEILRMIFRLYTEERRGLKALSAYLNRNKVPTPRGPEWARIYSGLWRDSTIRSILVNPLYCGDMVWNRRNDGRFHKIVGGRAVERRVIGGARLVPNAKTDWIIVRDSHPSLISRRTWELAQAIREGRPASESQRGVSKRPVGGWNGKRARFILSGLVRCGQCGGRYQGVTRIKGKPRNDGTKVKTRSYGCGDYIAKGRSVCSFNPVPQDLLEQQVIETVLEFYRSKYGGESGLDQLAATVREHLGVEACDLADARERLESDRHEIESTISNLLDNMTPAMRDLVEERLGELRRQRDDLRARAVELDRLSLNESEVQDLVQDIGTFLGGLPTVLLHGMNEHKQAALRRCVEQITIDRSDSIARCQLRTLPLQGSTRNSAVTIQLKLSKSRR